MVGAERWMTFVRYLMNAKKYSKENVMGWSGAQYTTAAGQKVMVANEERKV